MNALALVLAGHLVGDWIVQSDWQAANKVWPPAMTAGLQWEGDEVEVRVYAPSGTTVHHPIIVQARRSLRFTSWRANQQHMATYHLTLALLAMWALRWQSLVALLAISWVTHSVIDRRWPVKWLMARTGSRPFSETTFGVIAVDQALHLSILCILVAVLA